MKGEQEEEREYVEDKRVQVARNMGTNGSYLQAMADPQEEEVVEEEKNAKTEMGQTVRRTKERRKQNRRQKEKGGKRRKERRSKSRRKRQGKRHGKRS